jgi:hypothetical protein
MTSFQLKIVSLPRGLFLFANKLLLNCLYLHGQLFAFMDWL